MNEVVEVLQREFIYVWYYFTVQLRQIFVYWVLGMVVGSLVSVFAKDSIHKAFESIRDKKWGLWGVIPASPFRGKRLEIRGKNLSRDKFSSSNLVLTKTLTSYL